MHNRAVILIFDDSHLPQIVKFVLLSCLNVHEIALKMILQYISIFVIMEEVDGRFGLNVGAHLQCSQAMMPYSGLIFGRLAGPRIENKVYFSMKRILQYFHDTRKICEDPLMSVIVCETLSMHGSVAGLNTHQTSARKHSLPY